MYCQVPADLSVLCTLYNTDLLIYPANSQKERIDTMARQKNIKFQNSVLIIRQAVHILLRTKTAGLMRLISSVRLLILTATEHLRFIQKMRQRFFLKSMKKLTAKMQNMTTGW